MSTHITKKEKTEVLDTFSQKMTKSGHNLAVCRRIMVSGVTGHLRKVTRCEKEGKSFHRTAASSARTRKMKKTNRQTVLVQKPE